ncbi:MAG: cytochrome C [Myxococcota bacterium]
MEGDVASAEEELWFSSPAVGLALEVDNGSGVPVRVRAGQRFYINQLDVRAFVDVSEDNGVDTLNSEGDFASVPWSGVQFEEEEPVLLPNPDGTFTRRRFYRDAAWMNRPSWFVVVQVDDHGRFRSRPLWLYAGLDARRGPWDSFFIRRLRSMQWTFDCPGPDDCAGATNFQEEALVELRNSRQMRQTFRIHPRTTGLKVFWSLRPGAPWQIPLEQVEDPTYAYGFEVDVDALTPPAADGTYAPGSDVSFRITLRDGEGQRLHPEGSLPTYEEVIFGVNEPGIQYYRAFFDPTATYWRRKHQERMLMIQLIGPAQDIQPIRSIIDIEGFLGPEDTQVVGTPERDGVYAEFQTFPPGNDLFGGAIDPSTGGWSAPQSDEVNFHLPEDAAPGTYLVTLKARRTYLGEDIPRSATVEIQVGTPEPTEPQLTTGPCTSCHSRGGELSIVLHANDNRAACAACHVPLGFELEGPIFVRTHFIHSRSRRFDEPLYECSQCHLSEEGIQRTSKAACLSCHREYPETHVAWFGPIESIYVGGGRESFGQCTESCHVTHPGSGLDGL